jgi:lactate dehydrogenase-like 2-hydroxyacid dehydrogenase
MEVIISDRKSSITPSSNRVQFSEVLKRSTVLVIVVPKTKDTINLISEAELQTMNPHAVIINISRGGIVDEYAIMAALRKGMIAGYATDVFEVEPAEGAKDSPLLAPDARDLNLTLTPHVAWFGDVTRQNLMKILKENVEMFMAGVPHNVVV